MADFQAKSNIFLNIHMRKQGVFLKYSIQISLIWRHLGNVLAVKDDAALVRRYKTAQYPQCCCLTAARRSKQR